MHINAQPISAQGVEHPLVHRGRLVGGEVAADDVEVQPGRELVGDGARQCLVIERYDRAVDGDAAPLDRDAWLPVTRRSEHDD
jgi:hypothetical protein